MERFPKGMIFTGTALLGMSVALGWGGLGIIIRGEIAKQMRLINGTDTFDGWHNVPIPVYLSVYLFNLTNAEEVLKGAKPVVQETGPYVYKEKLIRDVTEDNVINETLYYFQVRTYTFEPSMSTGNEDDLITMINEPMLVVAKAMKDAGFDAGTVGKAESWLMEKGEKPVMTRPVREWLFGEFSVSNYVEMANESIITSSDKEFRLPNEFEDGMFSAIEMTRKNMSAGRDGHWMIQTGRNKTFHFAQTVGWNGHEQMLPLYKGDACNALNGTDGSLFAPFIKETTPLYIFAPEMCRSVMLTRHAEPMEVHNVEAHRYTMDPMVLAVGDENPDNWCFCSAMDDKCSKKGLHYIEMCLDRYPRSVSLPHFLGAEDSVKNAVDGLMPKDDGSHQTYFDLHTLSGIVLKSSKRLQFNLELMPYSDMPSFAKAPTVTLPVFWMDETLDADHSDIRMLIFIKVIQEIWSHIRWGCLAFSGLLVFIGVAIALTRRTSIKAERVTLIQ